MCDLCLLIHFFNICHRPKTNQNCFIGTSGMHNTNDPFFSPWTPFPQNIHIYRYVNSQTIPSSLHELHFFEILTYTRIYSYLRLQLWCNTWNPWFINTCCVHKSWDSTIFQGRSLTPNVIMFSREIT